MNAHEAVLCLSRQALPAAPDDARQGADRQRHWPVVQRCAPCRALQDICVAKMYRLVYFLIVEGVQTVKMYA